MAIVKDIIAGVVAPLTGYLGKRTERKMNRDTIKGKIVQQKQGDATEITLTDAQWEVVAAAMQDKTWKDEYVTVSVVLIFNLYIIGGIAAAFGHPQVLTGVTTGIAALVASGVDLGFLMTAVVLAAIGIKITRIV